MLMAAEVSSSHRKEQRSSIAKLIPKDMMALNDKLLEAAYFLGDWPCRMTP
jgi:hypothetical protein